MDWDRVIYNGTVVNDDGMQRADIYIRDGRVAAVTSERLPGTVGEATDASGRYILPGLIETHVHSRDGRLATGEKEDFRSSTAAAAATGITTVFEMPNCTPTIHSAESLRDLVSVIQPKAHADFCVWGLALGDANLASLPALAEAGCVAFKFFWGYAVDRRDNSLIYNYREGMDNVLPPPDDGQIYRLFRAVKATGKRLGIHAENFSIVRALTQEALAAGAQDYAALLRTRPVSCETSIIDTAIDMAKELSMPLHVLHVGVGDGVEHLRRAKADVVDVTAETCTHYLTFTDRDARRCGAVMKTYPLIRTAADRQAVWQGLADGTLDWVCSDHAPHTCEEKHRSFWDAPAGISGIEGLSPVLFTAVHRGLLTLPRVAAITSANAARTFGLYPRKGVIRPGADADLAIVDMSAAYTFRQEKMYSKAKWSPYDGMSFQGRVVETILRGRTTMRDGQVLPDCFGQFLPVCTK